MPKNIRKVFFRADSGSFSGKLFDLLESFGWDYLVKVKLKNLVILLKKQEWEVLDEREDIAIFEFGYKASSWKGARITGSGHQTKIRMYENHFYKADRKELDRLIEAA